MYYSSINRHCGEIQGALGMVSDIRFMLYGCRVDMVFRSCKIQSGVSTLHSKGMCLGALRILLQPFDMYLTVHTHWLAMTYSSGIISDRNFLDTRVKLHA